MITGAAFVELSAPFDHRILIQKISTSHGIALYVELSRLCCQAGDYISSWTTNVADEGNRRTGNVLSPALFSIYTNDQPIYHGTRSFIYADDLCVTAQYPSFTEVEETIEDTLEEITQYYRSNSL